MPYTEKKKRGGKREILAYLSEQKQKRNEPHIKN